MAMNLWQCQSPGCPSKAVGVGGAVGLRAIGWYFQIGPSIYCPCHRPDGIPGVQDCHLKKCGHCRARQEAAEWQTVIAQSQLALSRCARCGSEFEQGDMLAVDDNATVVHERCADQPVIVRPDQ